MTAKALLQAASDGTAIPAGFVGEVLSVLGSEGTTATTGGVTVTLATLPITSAGVWRVDFYVWNIEAEPVGANGLFVANAKYNDSAFTPGAGTNADSSGVIGYRTPTGNLSLAGASSIPGVVVAADGTKSVTLRQMVNISTGIAAYRGKIVATRIA